MRRRGPGPLPLSKSAGGSGPGGLADNLMVAKKVIGRRICRRRFLSAVGATAIATGLYTWRIEPTWVEFVSRELALPGLPKAWEGMTLVHLSDIHVGPRVDDDFLRRTFGQVSALAPDMVAYTGDFISYRGPETLEQLRRIDLPCGRLGTVAALGNHDYGHAWSEPKVADAVAGVLRDAGVVVLRDETSDFAGLKFAGLDDLWAGRLSLKPVMDEEPDIVLCHNPDGCDLDGWADFSGWILAGHTHGGQCKPPFLPPPLLPVKNRRYTAGEFALSADRRLYINRGLGHLLRIRFNVRPEVTVFRCVPANRS